MDRWIVLPYDESLVARMALHRTGRLAQVASGESGGIVLAACGTDASILGPIVERAKALTSPHVRLEARLIAAANPGVSLLRLVEDRPNAALAAPIGVNFDSLWYAEAARAVIACRTCPVYAFYVDEGMVREAKEETHDRPSVDRFVGAVLRGCARLRLGVRSLMKGGAR
jgi:hypothetical protein